VVPLNPQLRTRIKFCGITRLADARAAVACGADALGFVLAPRSQRYLGLDAAWAIRAQLPPFVAAVVLLQDADAEFVHQAIAALKPDCLQFHGQEPEDFCAGFGLPYIKACAMRGRTRPIEEFAAQYPTAGALLLDGHAPGELGGQGERFDWHALNQRIDKPLILAGGLDASNVGGAIRIARPYGVDVSSGIESAPGIKDSGRMAAFARAVRHADESLTK
jgi:phosphoribosylanthranilate isomerase